MNDSIKLILITLAATLVVFAGGEALGVNWLTVQGTILYFVRTIGILFLLFTGGAAALEIAKYFRFKNHQAEKEEAASLQRDLLLEKGELHDLVAEAVASALAASAYDDGHPAQRNERGPLLDALEEIAADVQEDRQVRRGAKKQH
jgi:uncharacterized membrane protein YebE (DUF533 family)